MKNVKLKTAINGKVYVKDKHKAEYYQGKVLRITISSAEEKYYVHYSKGISFEREEFFDVSEIFTNKADIEKNLDELYLTEAELRKRAKYNLWKKVRISFNWRIVTWRIDEIHRPLRDTYTKGDIQYVVRIRLKGYSGDEYVTKKEHQIYSSLDDYLEENVDNLI